jgi:AcrR family transcriptional regulator
MRSEPDVVGDDGAAPRFTPTSARGQRTRAAIVTAAREVFETRGFADTNVAAITAAAGVGYGSFYVYFASKDEVFAEVARQIQEYIYIQSRSEPSARDPLVRLREENRRFFELYRENARMIQLIEEVAQVSEDFRRVREDQRRMYVERSARALTRLQKAGRMDPKQDALYTVYALGAMVERMAYLCSRDDSLDAERSLDIINMIWSRAIGIEDTGNAGRLSRPPA